MSGICSTMQYLSDFNKTGHKRSLFNAVLEGFNSFQNSEGAHIRRNNMRKIIQQKVSHNL